MENCLFCKIINGEIPSSKVYEDDEILAFNDINPSAPIHVLVIPKKHVANILELKGEDIALIEKITKAIQNIAKELNIEESGFRLISNCGPDSGQEVNHLHFHLLAGKKMGPKIIS